MANEVLKLIERDITDVVIDSTVTTIGYGAFSNCQSLTSLTIGENVSVISDVAFFRCTSLENVTIPISVTSIGSSAFSSCSALANITIPDNVTSIGNYAFNGCSSLTSVTVEATTPPTLGSAAFDDTNNCPILVPAESVDAYKTAWPAYADRIQAIKKYFVKLTDTSTVPTGTYLIVNETTSNVMESSLIKDTTSYSTGLNTFDNGVGLKQVEIVDNAIEATPEMLNYAVSYNVGSDKSTLSWTDPQDGTVYYLGNYQNGWVYGNDRFTQWNITNSNGHFKYGSRYLDIRKTNEISYFGWALAAYTNSIVLYKLEE